MGCDHTIDHTHQHSDACGHKMANHLGHMDFVCEGRLHHPHGPHCDDHGLATLV